MLDGDRVRRLTQHALADLNNIVRLPAACCPSPSSQPMAGEGVAC
jgi:hypothetical protein